MKKIFIDGSQGTTGLKIYERFANRNDVEILTINPEKRKDPVERAKMINSSDITFLCLPDAASIEAVSLVENDNVTIIDTSTAHRTNPEWAYGFPELDDSFKEKIKKSKRIANPGCYASGVNALVYPLIKAGIMPKDYPLVTYAMSGYSGGGNKAIAQYDDEDRNTELDSPRQYALTQEHKHLKEIKAICQLDRTPIFAPHICDYYSGMVVSIGLFPDLLTKAFTVDEIRDIYKKHYSGKEFIKVRDNFDEAMIGANNFSNRDDMEIIVYGNNERIMVSSRFDNLGKGASGAAIQCMNIVLGIDEKTGLNLGD